MEHDFKVKTHWSGGRNEKGTFEADHLKGEISIPSELGGIGNASNPDELLVSAASGCYIISLAAALERSRFTDVVIEQESIGTASLDAGKFKMVKITHHPKITVNEAEYKKLEKQIDRITEIADGNCMISNSIRGNVEIEINAEIILK